MNIQYREPAWFRKPLLFIETFSSLGTVIDNRPWKERSFFRDSAVSLEKTDMFIRPLPLLLLIYILCAYYFMFVFYYWLLHHLLISLTKSISFTIILLLLWSFYCYTYIHRSWIGRNNVFAILFTSKVRIDIFIFNDNIRLFTVCFTVWFCFVMNYIYINFACKIDNFFFLLLQWNSDYTLRINRFVNEPLCRPSF